MAIAPVLSEVSAASAELTSKQGRRETVNLRSSTHSLSNSLASRRAPLPPRADFSTLRAVGASIRHLLLLPALADSQLRSQKSQLGCVPHKLRNTVTAACYQVQVKVQVGVPGRLGRRIRSQQGANKAANQSVGLNYRFFVMLLWLDAHTFCNSPGAATSAPHHQKRSLVP